MAFQVTLPPSVITKMTKSEEGEEPKKQSREDWRKMKELEEARKAGTAPAMQDEEGKDINPHIPQYIMQAPWYFGTTAATLKHQRPQPEKQKEFSKMGEWYKKGMKQGQIATKYRKGSCENCGAMTHKKKDCLERPRKTGAKYTGEEFAPDEFIQPQLSFDYDGKRDRWNGFDITEHQQIVQEEFAKIEEAKRMHKDHNMDKLISEESKQKTDGDSDDEDKYAEDMEMPGQKFETKQRITVRNLRIREDTAKYLYNLDVNSSFYDPKTRSMRGNPYEMKTKDPSDATYSGDNFVRSSGDAHKFAKMQLFAWEAYERGADVHLQADPTKSELLVKEFDKRKDDFKTDQKQSILDKYGGHEHLEAPPKQLLLAQSENYVEYSRHGSVIKGQEKVVIRSKYEEDIYLNNHTSVWGSYWKNGQWGFKCCHSIIKESYCTGEAGQIANVTDENCPLTEANQESGTNNQQNTQIVQYESPEEHHSKKNKKKKKKEKKKKKKKKKHSSDDSSEESDSDEEKQRQKKLEKALKKEDQHQRDVAKLMQMDERKRPYNSMYDAKAPTEEEIEAYHMKRLRYEDPMASFAS